MAKTAKEEGQAVEVEVSWEDVASLPTTYANQAIVSHAGGNEFYLLFGEVMLPVTAGLRGEGVDKVSVRPVAKIALSPSTMMRVAAAVQKNVAR